MCKRHLLWSSGDPIGIQSQVTQVPLRFDASTSHQQALKPLFYKLNLKLSYVHISAILRVGDLSFLLPWASTFGTAIRNMGIPSCTSQPASLLQSFPQFADL